MLLGSACAMRAFPDRDVNIAVDWSQFLGRADLLWEWNTT